MLLYSAFYKQSEIERARLMQFLQFQSRPKITMTPYSPGFTIIISTTTGTCTTFCTQRLHNI